MQYPIKHVSASSIKCYNTCPYAFKAKYILKLKQPSNEHFAFGTGVHSTTELFMTIKNRSGKIPPLSAIMKHYQKTMKDEAEKLGPRQKDALREMYETGHDLSEKLYYKMIEWNTTDEALMFWADLGWPKKAFGFFDVPVPGGIKELKTTSSGWSKADRDSSIQFTIYNEAYYKIKGVWPKMDLVELNKKTLEIKETPIRRNSDSRMKLDLLVDKMFKGMDNDEYPRCEKRNCWACSL